MLGYELRWEALWPYQELIGHAFLVSVRLAVLSLLLGGVLGLVLAYASSSKIRLLRLATVAYVDAIRNTPLLLLVFIVYLVVPELGLPGLDADGTFVAALAMAASGVICENLRAAFASMPKGYLEAAMAVGLRAWQRQAYIVLPIALRYALPALTNSAVSVFKDTSLASIIAIKELTYAAREISTNTFRVFEAWIVIAVIYLIVTTAMAALSRMLERRLSKAM